MTFDTFLQFLLISISGVEVKAICPSWADTEIVSGVDGEERKVMIIIFIFTIIIIAIVFIIFIVFMIVIIFIFIIIIIAIVFIFTIIVLI